MEKPTGGIIRHAQLLAQELSARAILVCADAIASDDEASSVLESIDFPAIVVTRSPNTLLQFGTNSITSVRVPNVAMTRAGQIRTALLVCLVRGVLSKGDRVLCLSGVDESGTLDTLVVLDLNGKTELFSLFDLQSCADLAPEVLEKILTLATQLAAEGREGKPVGALFVLGDGEHVLQQSRSLILNPFYGHPESSRNILDPGLEETLKEFSALDGAIVVRGDGVVLTAGSHLMPPVISSTRVADGLGTRHGAAANISASTAAVAICVSQSTGTVSVYKGGFLVTDIPRPNYNDHLPI